MSDNSDDCLNRITQSALLDRSSYLIMGSQIKALRFLPNFTHFVLLYLHMGEKQTWTNITLGKNPSPFSEHQLVEIAATYGSVNCM